MIHSLWRGTAILGFLTGATAANALITSALFDLDILYFERAFEGTPRRELTAHWQVMFFIVTVGTPLILGAIYAGMNSTLFIPEHFLLIRQSVSLLLSGSLASAGLVGVGFYYAETYAETPAELAQWIRLMALGFNLYNLMMSLALTLLMLGTLRARTGPFVPGRGLLGLSLLALGMSVAGFNPDLPAYRVIMALPVISTIAIIVASYLWLISAEKLPPPMDDATTWIH